MELVATAASFAKNACTWSAGRPPYIAAFGRIPRMGLDLISDENGFVAGSTRSEVHHQASLLRAEAQQHLAAMSVDAGFRRALLRKSSTEQIVDVPIGSVVAYWRWTAKSSKKRGGFKLARLLGRDPDGKSMWLQAGTNTIKVAQHQLRIARGFEQWNPDYSDIKQLRAASDNMQSNFLQDESLPEQEQSDSGSQVQGVDHPEFLQDTLPEDIPVPDIPDAVPIRIFHLLNLNLNLKFNNHLNFKKKQSKQTVMNKNHNNLTSISMSVLPPTLTSTTNKIYSNNRCSV